MSNQHDQETAHLEKGEAHAEPHELVPLPFTDDLSVLMNDMWELYPDPRWSPSRRTNAIARLLIVAAATQYIVGPGKRLIGLALLLTVLAVSKWEEEQSLQRIISARELEARARAPDRTRASALVSELPAQKPMIPSRDVQVFSTHPPNFDDTTDWLAEGNSVATSKFVSRPK